VAKGVMKFTNEGLYRGICFAQSVKTLKMKEFRNPLFDIGVLGAILFFAGVFILTTNKHYGYIVLFTGLGLGVIFSMVSLIEIARSQRLTGQKKMLWLMIVFLLPIIGSFIYYIFSGSNEKRTIE
jgi:hypothetical protein